MKNVDSGTAQAYRASFNSAPCGNFEPGPHHAGHMRCIKLKRHIEALVRNKRSDAETAERRKQQALEDLVKKSTTEHTRTGRKRKR